MASFMSLLTRRQADRTISMLGICFFILKWPPLIISSQPFSGESGREQAEKMFDSVHDLMRTNGSYFFQFACLVVRFDYVSSEQTCTRKWHRTIIESGLSCQTRIVTIGPKERIKK
jgi:hypothetical protein